MDATNHGVNQGLNDPSSKFVLNEWTDRPVTEFSSKVVSWCHDIDPCAKQRPGSEHSGLGQGPPLRWDTKVEFCWHLPDLAASENPCSARARNAKLVGEAEVRRERNCFRSSSKEAIRSEIDSSAFNDRRGNLASEGWRRLDEANLERVVGRFPTRKCPRRRQSRDASTKNEDPRS